MKNNYISKNRYNKRISPNKEQTSYDDSLDSLKLSLKGYNIGKILLKAKFNLNQVQLDLWKTWKKN